MAQPQEYTVKSWSVWQDKENDGAPVRDLHGNYKGSVLFEEYTSEPIDATFKEPPLVGQKKYGIVDPYTTKSGRVRIGFKSAPRPIPVPAQSVPQQQERQPFKADPDKQADIKGEWAIRLVVEHIGVADLPKVERIARELYQMVDKVKKPDLLPDPMNRVFQDTEYYPTNELPPDF